MIIGQAFGRSTDHRGPGAQTASRGLSAVELLPCRFSTRPAVLPSARLFNNVGCAAAGASAVVQEGITAVVVAPLGRSVRHGLVRHGMGLARCAQVIARLGMTATVPALTQGTASHWHSNGSAAARLRGARHSFLKKHDLTTTEVRPSPWKAAGARHERELCHDQRPSSPFEEDERRPRIETLAIAKITQDKEIAARDLDFDIVSEYWERLNGVTNFPPLQVMRDDHGIHWLWDRLSSPRSGMPEQARKRSRAKFARVIDAQRCWRRPGPTPRARPATQRGGQNARRAEAAQEP